MNDDPESTSYHRPHWPHCTCSREYRPVCGYNGRTYNNKCLADCDGIVTLEYLICRSFYLTKINFQGIACKRRCPCKHVCDCSREYRPVCGVNDRTYSNKCLAKCAGIVTNEYLIYYRKIIFKTFFRMFSAEELVRVGGNIDLINFILNQVKHALKLFY